LLAENSERLAFASANPRQRPIAETLTAEVIPLADACKFLERQAARLLAPRKLGRTGRPIWLNGVHTEIRREPLGVVLIIAPSNYPLFLPGVQVLQALTAGNAVLLKPGTNGTPAAVALAELVQHAGFDHHLLQVLPESIDAVRGALDGGVAKVVLTGSANTGAAVLAELAPRLIPATMELSGCDAVFIRADADLDLAVRALTFGLRLNNGATCIAPRRVFVHRSVATEFEGRLANALPTDTANTAPLPLRPELRHALEDALAHGAHFISGKLLFTGDCVPPLVVAGATTAMRLLHEDVFAPIMSLITVTDDHEAIELARQCPYALGATVFSRDEASAREFAQRIRAGLVIINDVIVPSADPRIPFGGRGRSGFGVTRGADGLLEMTAPKVVSVRRSKYLPHLDAEGDNDGELFQSFLLLAHGRGFTKRFQALKNIFRLGCNRRPSNSKTI
jgi:acyl-CoA reductase-like NAD-dependent aldehyde dehydrogenase